MSFLRRDAKGSISGAPIFAGNVPLPALCAHVRRLVARPLLALGRPRTATHAAQHAGSDGLGECSQCVAPQTPARRSARRRTHVPPRCGRCLAPRPCAAVADTGALAVRAPAVQCRTTADQVELATARTTALGRPPPQPHRRRGLRRACIAACRAAPASPAGIRDPAAPACRRPADRGGRGAARSGAVPRPVRGACRHRTGWPRSRPRDRQLLTVAFESRRATGRAPPRSGWHSCAWRSRCRIPARACRPARS